MIVNILGMLVIGLIVGALARFLVPGRDPMGCIATSLLGIAGSFVGGFLYQFLFRPGSVNHPAYANPGFLVSLIGAILVLVIFRAVTGRRAV